MNRVGITENGDAALDTSWERWALEKREPTILITKNIKKLLISYPNILLQPNIIVHAGITGYGGTIFEQKVPKAAAILSCLEQNVRDNVVIRIDPIIPLEPFIQQSKIIFDQCVKFGFKRFRISILDLYPHVLARFAPYHELTFQLKQMYEWDLSHSLGGQHKDYMIHTSLSIRRNIVELFVHKDVETAVCCEPGFDKELCNELGVVNDGCVSKKDLQLMGVKLQPRYTKNTQRQFCQCLSIKKELCVKDVDCEHGCIYCYQRWKFDKLMPSSLTN
jgi:DNA repair photolyase